MSLRIPFVAALAFALAGCAQQEAATPNPEPAGAAELAVVTDADILHMITERVETQRWATGIVIGVARPEGTSIVSYGTTSLDGGEPVDGDTVFDIASLGKIATALLFADAAAQGEVSLDDALKERLPGLTGPSAFEGREITLTDLATHTAGLTLRPPNLPSTDKDNPYAGYTDDMLLRSLEGYSLKRAPGEKFEYSNWGYGFLGAAIAEAAKTPYPDLVAAKVLSPLGMSDTAFELTPSMEARFAQGYDHELKNTPERWSYDALAPAGALRSTVNDMLKFLAVFAGETPPAFAEAKELMFSVRRPGDDGDTKMAIGWRVTTRGERTFIWSNGSSGGFRSFMGFNPETKVAVVGFANAATPLGVDDIGRRVLDPTYPVNLAPPVVRTEVTLTTAELDRVVGLYEYAPDDQVRIERRGAQLFCIIPPHELEVFAESEDHFFLKIVDAQMEFSLPSGGGPATAMLWRQDGVDYPYKRVD